MQKLTMKRGGESRAFIAKIMSQKLSKKKKKKAQGVSYTFLMYWVSYLWRNIKTNRQNEIRSQNKIRHVSPCKELNIFFTPPR